MLSVDSIRERLAAVAAGQVALDDFEDWIVASSWNVIQQAPQDVRQLVGAIELRLAEYSSGHLEEDELTQEFFALANHGLPMQPIEATFISISEPSELAVTLTTYASEPDVELRAWTLDRVTRSTTLTASGRSVIQPAASAA